MYALNNADGRLGFLEPNKFNKIPEDKIDSVIKSYIEGLST